MIVLAAVQIAIAFTLSPLLTIGVLCWGGLLLALLQRRFGNRYQEGSNLLRHTVRPLSKSAIFCTPSSSPKAITPNPATLPHSSWRWSARHPEHRLEQQHHSHALGDPDQRSGHARRLCLFWRDFRAGRAGGFARNGRYFLSTGTADFRISARMAELVHMLPAFDRVIELSKFCAAAAEPCLLCLAASICGMRLRLPASDSVITTSLDQALLKRSISSFLPARRSRSSVRPVRAKARLRICYLGILTPDTGTVLIDGVPLTGALLARWRRSIGYVPQDNFLFNDTIRANLLWAFPEAREQDFRRGAVDRRRRRIRRQAARRARHSGGRTRPEVVRR